MLDSLLTLTKGAAAWMAGFFVICVIVNRGITALTGVQEPIFLLLGFLILCAFLVMATYTAGKWAVHLLKGDSPHSPPEE